MSHVGGGGGEGRPVTIDPGGKHARLNAYQAACFPHTSKTPDPRVKRTPADASEIYKNQWHVDDLPKDNRAWMRRKMAEEYCDPDDETPIKTDFIQSTCKGAWAQFCGEGGILGPFWASKRTLLELPHNAVYMLYVCCVTLCMRRLRCAVLTPC